MELLIEVADRLRNEHKFNGYIHLKAIPGADEILIKNACHLNKNKKVILNINQKNIDVFKNYFTKNPPLDIFNIKPFDLKIVVENRNGFRVYNSQLKFINSTQKPKIIASGIIDISFLVY